MRPHPVHYTVEHPAQFTRLQLLIRAVAFLALGAIGLSFGVVFFFAYLALPVYAASRLGGRDARAYVAGDGPRVVTVLRWLAAISAWAGLTAERLPAEDPQETVHLDVELTAHPTPGSAIARVFYGLPSALALAILGWVGALVWLWAAITILVSQRVGNGAFGYLVGLQRWSLRLLAYQASLVDAYPPFSLSDSPPSTLPTARAAL